MTNDTSARSIKLGFQSDSEEEIALGIHVININEVDAFTQQVATT